MSHNSRMQSNISLNSRESGKESRDTGQASRKETSMDIKTKRDAFLIRFKNQSADFVDKIITETNLFAELEKSESHKYWHKLSSISLTPNAKVGLGQLYTFEFIAPSFETKPAGKVSRKQQLKLESMSFYGQVKFNFR